jgi:bifunctional non-homologous end joining protein LigD
MTLTEYHRKRHFDKTKEPAGEQRAARKATGKTAGRRAAPKRSFVIQEHAATRLHYDFRLELDGVLKSWAVPKGPSFDPAEKRLAVEVEDHPIEYAKFEGTIPEGEYGAGEVIVWDRGTWSPLGDPREDLRRGQLKFTLDGEKLQGEWVLVRLAARKRSDKNNWLLIKHRDEFARPLTEYDVLADQPQSVKTGRTLDELTRENSEAPVGKKMAGKKMAGKKMAGKKAARKSAKPKSRAAGKAAKKRAQKKSNLLPAEVTGAVNAPLPKDVEVELATLESHAPQGQQWLHEIKFDGYRLLARIDRGHVKLITRRHQDWTHRYPSVAEAAASLPVKSALLDGELVALLPSGVSSFQSLQNATRPGSDARLVYFAFDLLYLDGYDLRRSPLIERKQQLRELLTAADSPVIQYSDHVEGAGTDFLRESCRLGLEGIVSKRGDRPYVGGRAGDWIKTKCLGREELVIGGFTLSTADRRGIGALLVGYFDEGQFVYAGRVGTGFDTQTLLDLRRRLEAIKQDKPPFRDVPSKERGPSVKWVKPQLVAEIKFSSWTDAGYLRQPSFEGLREDKPATDVGIPASLQIARKSETAPPAAALRKTMSHAKSSGSNKSSGSKRSTATRAGTVPSINGSTAAAANRKLDLTHPERILFPDTGLTKLGLANYYVAVAEWMLPHLVDRPLSLVRCPAGQAAGKCFYQKHAGDGTPGELGRVKIKEKDGPEEYVYVRDMEGLLSLVQMSVLEIHPWGAKRDNVEKPDRLTFDLDPGPDVAWPRVIDAAFAVRELLTTDYGLESFLKTTGGKGLHVVVPISPRRHGWNEAKQFCRHVAEQIANRDPKRYTVNMAKAQRAGRIFVDYLRNDRGATAVAAYSTRARPGAPISTPLDWDELTPAIRSDHFHVGNFAARLTALKADPWKKIGDVKQSFPSVD